MTGRALGARAAALHLDGRGDFCNMFVLEIPAGVATSPQRHVYEEVIYVLEGHGNTEITLLRRRTPQL